MRERMWNFYRWENEMKFDYIIGNPPYQDDSISEGNQAKPVYNIFFDQLKSLNPKVISLIIPSRWFTGGIGLDSFRNSMMNDNKIKYIDDYINAKQCFPEASISGGVCTFLWDRDYNGDCKFTNIKGDSINTLVRPLNEFKVLVRYNEAVNIIHKIFNISKNNMVELVGPISPFWLSTKIRGEQYKTNNNYIVVYSSAVKVISILMR